MLNTAPRPCRFPPKSRYNLGITSSRPLSEGPQRWAPRVVEFILRVWMTYSLVTVAACLIAATFVSRPAAAATPVAVTVASGELSVGLVVRAMKLVSTNVTAAPVEQRRAFAPAVSQSCTPQVCLVTYTY